MDVSAAFSIVTLAPLNVDAGSNAFFYYVTLGYRRTDVLNASLRE